MTPAQPSSNRSSDAVTGAGAPTLTGLTAASLRAIGENRPGYTPERGEAFLRFRSRLAAELLNHRVITENRYTAWFSSGEQSEADIKAFIVQFSVFSNQFLIAQLNKVVNADTLEGMRASKEILANELGVTFNKAGTSPPGRSAGSSFDPDHVGTEGTIQGGLFHFEAGHFEVGSPGTELEFAL